MQLMEDWQLDEYCYTDALANERDWSILSFFGFDLNFLGQKWMAAVSQMYLKVTGI